MFPGRSSLLIACAGLSLLTGREAAAESRLAVSPTVLELSAENPVAVLTVTNSDDAPTTMQISTVAWIADGDAFREQATREILASPAVIEVPPNSSQTVRVGLTRAAPKTGAERSYRVIIRESGTIHQRGRATAIPDAPEPAGLRAARGSHHDRRAVVRDSHRGRQAARQRAQRGH
ncbi:MAG: molecular chaperone [Acidobacteria bacterium]|nr:molecular chaperone [Acidobacteriota bacterium]